MNSINSPLYFIGQGDWEVPNPNDAANEEGLIALSWELYPEMYERLYPIGIFPWFDQDGVVFWFSPPVRSVTPTGAVVVAKSMRPYMNKGAWRFSVNTAFQKVLEGCSTMPRPGQAGTWISEMFLENFAAMHQKGRAHSFEVWDGEELIGGTFGVMTGNVFVGESMFHSVKNASKYAYIGMCQYLASVDVGLVDNQLPTPHLDSLGAENWDRQDYLDYMGVHAPAGVANVAVPEVHSFALRY